MVSWLGKGRSAHLPKSSSAILTYLLRSSALFPLIEASTTTHTPRQYLESCKQSSLSIILSWLVAVENLRYRRRTRTLTRVKTRMALTVLKTCCPGESSATQLSRILILSLRNFRARAPITAAFRRGTSTAMEVEFRGCRRSRWKQVPACAEYICTESQ